LVNMPICPPILSLWWANPQPRCSAHHVDPFAAPIRPPERSDGQLRWFILGMNRSSCAPPLFQTASAESMKSCVARSDHKAAHVRNNEKKRKKWCKDVARHQRRVCAWNAHSRIYVISGELKNSQQRTGVNARYYVPKFNQKISLNWEMFRRTRWRFWQNRAGHFDLPERGNCRVSVPIKYHSFSQVDTQSLWNCFKTWFWNLCAVPR
jgi:hypothetical protein